MNVKASAKSVNMTPRKVGEVVSLVRNRKLDDALVILQHTPRRSALPVRKLLQSAKANAENNHEYNPASLFIESIYVTPGPSLKRFRPAARGRAMPYEKKTSHVHVELAGEKRAKKQSTKSNKPKTDKSKTSKKRSA